MKTVVDVQIMGQRLRVTSDDSEAHVRQVAEYLNGRMRELAAQGAGVRPLDVAILAALNIASEYWKLKEQQEEISRVIDRLAGRLVEGLAG